MTLPDSGLIAHRHIPDTIEIEITETGAILANSELLDLDATSRDLPMLVDRLRTYAESARLTDSPARVSIAAADEVAGQRLVETEDGGLAALQGRGGDPEPAPGDEAVRVGTAEFGPVRPDLGGESEGEEDEAAARLGVSFATNRGGRADREWRPSHSPSRDFPPLLFRFRPPSVTGTKSMNPRPRSTR